MTYALLGVLPWLALAGYMVLGIRRPRPLPEVPRWDRGEAPFVSVIVPARNEARSIERCLRSLAAQDYPAFEIVVVDDGSEDGTGELARGVPPGRSRAVRVVSGESLPEDWFGKPWACFQGARAARGDLLLFTDADTVHAPDLLGRTVAALREDGVAALSPVGRQEMETFGERLIQPQMFVFLGLRYPRVDRVLGPPRWRDAILSGQYILIRREAYDEIGGHEAVKGEVVEDLRLAQELVRRGHHIAFRGAEERLSTRMYHSLAEAVEGWTKNLYVGAKQAAGRLGRAAVPAGVGFLLVAWIVPPLTLLLVGAVRLQGGGTAGPLAAWAGGATAVGLALWAGAYRRLGVPLPYSALYPVGAATVALVIIRSWLRGEGRIEWKGRTYGAGRDVPERGRTRRLKELAREEGFELAGVCRPGPSEHLQFLEGWLARGFHGEMGYLARPAAVARRGDLTLTFSEVRSVLVVAHGYDQPDPDGVPDDPSRGVVARYARGRDYHKVVEKGLKRVHRRFQDEVGREVPARPYVDTGPLLERELARRAGIGWFGKNTMILNPRRGSYFFLGVLLLGIDLEPDVPFDEDHCGTCRACLDACPTGALLGRDETGAPVMDARLCISYLTIEHRGPIPRELRPLIGNRIFGCDICQEVCPFNVKFSDPAAEPGYAARGPGERPVGVEREGGKPAAGGGLANENVSAETFLHPGTDAPSLTDLLATALSEEAWDAFSRGSAIRRAGRAGFARNVCVAIGNWLADDDRPDSAAVELLVRALSDSEPLVRGHAAWALGRVGVAEARCALDERLTSEEEAFVRDELRTALRD